MRWRILKQSNMNKIYTTLLLLFFASTISANSLIQQADSAYTEDNFVEAISLYNKILQEEGTSSLLYYNLGNSYYRIGKLGKAIVCYERSVILDPSNEDARTNLEFVKSQITDKPGDNGTWISNTINELITNTHANTWAIFAIISFLLLLCSIIVYIYSSKILFRKLGFFSAIILLFCSIVTNIFAYKAATNANKHNLAIVIEPSTILSTSPRIPKDRTEEAMLLHEGTKVEILDSIYNSTSDKWYDVKVDNSHRAWINANAVEII